MEADTSDIDAKIAALLAEKQKKLDAAARESARREKEASRVLVGLTPTKIKSKGIGDVDNEPRPKQPDFSKPNPKLTPTISHPQRQQSQSAPLHSIPGPSKMSQALASLRRNTASSSSRTSDDDTDIARVGGGGGGGGGSSRSISFATKRVQPETRSLLGTRRDETNGLRGNRLKTNSQLVNQRDESSHLNGNQQDVSNSLNGNLRDSSNASSKKEENTDIELEVEDPTREQDSMMVVERLKPGPKHFGRDPEGEEVWAFVEPNSGIRLSERKLPHAQLQDHLFGRYYLSPSLLYSVIRLSKDGATYDVPVEGDWVTIAVVAERGDIRVSGSKESLTQSDNEDDDADNGKQQTDHKPKQGDKRTQEQRDKDSWKKRRGPRKYINLKLCALPPRGSKQGGEALLQLLLFQADAILSQEPENEGDEITKSYRGGSGGAYERWCNLNVGDVVAILNPRVLRPLRSGSQAPHPLTLPLALNPNSADAITLIGHARDLGCCTAQQRDGNRCKSWVDLRESQVCEYHVHAAVQRSRAGRAEFTASTSSFALQSRSTQGGKTKFDLKKKTGLLPGNGPQAAPRDQYNGGGGATYLVGGNTINTARLRDDGGLKHFGDEHLNEKLGRNRAGKRRRQLEEKEAEKALQSLLERDSGMGSQGAKYLKAVEGFKRAKGVEKGDTTTTKGKGGQQMQIDEDGRKRPFSAGAIKRIGFDPSSRTGARDGEDVAKRVSTSTITKKHMPGADGHSWKRLLD
ncbi:hypothetical protein BCR39DRAFT_547670 [Naematelia encephala]|uniref:Zinc finger Mcm10/DnaG-type domain-containing protein n=1 Tax=Naematelia encephala TaxID=71784 RepID=A0A1Y2ANJ2_9TREE|nr:hypothetical protein BCR39DRAFT_547670 [Naematelia encephala]